MDFFLRSGENLVSVEVKIGNTKAKSMRVLMDDAHYKDIRWGIKLVKDGTATRAFLRVKVK